MGVVRCRHRDAGLPRQADELRQHDLVFFKAVVLQFDVIVALAEQVPIPQRCLLGAVIVPCQNRAGYLARQAGGQADQTIVVLFQQFLIDTRLGVKTLGKAGRHHLDKVLVACLVFAEQNQVVVAVDTVDLIKAGAGGYIDLTADDGLDARRFGRIKESHAAVHDTVVGDSARRLPHRFQLVKHPVNAAGTVQQAVLGVDMKVCELSRGRFRHGVFPFRQGPCPGGRQPPVSSSSGGKARLCSPADQTSGPVFIAPAACSFSMASCTCTAAWTLLPRLAVSQLERRFVLLRISL